MGLVACGGSDDDKSPTGPKTRTPEEARRDLTAIGVEYTEEEFLYAVNRNDTLAVHMFLDAGMPPNTEDWEGNSALLLAIEDGYIETVLTILNLK